MKAAPYDEAIAKVSESIDDKEVISLSQELIRIPSVYRKEHEVSAHIMRKLAGWGFDPVSVPVDGFGPCVVCQLGSGKRKTVAMNGHMDTVEVKDGWKHDPFGAKIEKGMLYGLGSLDMKSGLAALLIAFKTIAESGAKLDCNVRFQAVTGEEENSAGVRTLIANGYFKDVKATIVGEGIGGLGVITHGRRGGSYYEIEVFGRSAHGSTPHLGVNAITDAAKIIAALDGMKMRSAKGLVSDTGKTLSESQLVLRISGGDVSYSVPDRCKFRVMRATVPGYPIDITDDLKRVIRGLKLKSRVEIKMQRTPGDLLRPYASPTDSEIVKTARKWIMHYTSRDPRLVCGLSEADDNQIAELTGVPVICVGPGERGKLARYHRAEEAVSIAQLGVASRIYCSTVLDLASKT